MNSTSILRASLALLMVAVLAINLGTITAYPPPHCDETYYTDTANTWLTQGHFGTRVHGPVYGLDQNHTIIGRLYTVGLAGVVGLLGISLTSVRLYSVLGWLAAAAGTYFLGRRLYGRQTALWGALLFAVSFKAYFSSHLTRPEIWLAAGAVWVLNFLIDPASTPANPRAGRLRALLLGLAGAMLVDIHFIGAFFLAGLSLVALYQWLYLPWRASRLNPQSPISPLRFDLVLLFFTGTALAFVIWAALHFLPDPEPAWYQWWVGHTRLGMGAGSRSLLAAFLDLGPWIREGFWRANRGLNALEGLLFAASLIYALSRRSRSDVVMLLIFTGSLATFGALFAQKLSSYRVLWTPLLWLLAAEFVSWALAKLTAALPASWLARLPAVHATGNPHPANSLSLAWVFAPLCVVYMFSAGWLVWTFRGGRRAETSAALRSLIPPGTTVLGDPIWWFDFQADHRYIGDLYLTYYSSAVSSPAGEAVPVAQRLTEQQVAEALQEIDADYVILDARLHCLLDLDYQPFFAYRDYVAANCERIGAVTGGWYGQPWAITYPLGEESVVYQCA